MSELDLFALPLTGNRLIEANAGTGKTYSITALHLRLLVEQQREIEEILVVTFTRAATAELKRRLRERLEAARCALMGRPVEDEFVTELVARLEGETQDILDRVERSLRAFDLAPVLTIHGFCQQVLSRFAFEAGWDPDRELIEREASLLRPLVAGAWERLARGFSAEFAAWLRRPGVELQTLAERVVEQAERPGRRVIPPTFQMDQLDRLEVEGRRAVDRLCALWSQDRQGVCELLHSDALQERLFSDKAVTETMAALDGIHRDPSDWVRQVKALERLTRARLARATRAGKQVPDHPISAHVEDLVEARDGLLPAYRQRKDALWFELHQEVCRQRDAIKERDRVRTYDDLLADLRHALERRPALAAHIRNAYPVALIDEFQDTDDQQYAIFRRIDPGRDGLLVFVGDPKQALYSFRGADVYAYLAARDTALSVDRLAQNWRSHPALLEPINRLFQTVDHPFLTPGIEFIASRSGAPDREDALQIDEQAVAPFQFWLLPPEGKKNELREECARAVAREIVRLVDRGRAGRVRLGTEPLRAGDIAVLVRSHDQADRVARALAAVGLGCAQTGRTTVWQTEQAEELLWLLQGVLDCERPGVLATALATRLIGFDARRLAEIHQDDAQADHWYQRFAEFRDLWREEGIAALVSRILTEFEIAARWLTHRNGERVLTNVFHLQDLLSAREHEFPGSPASLVDYLIRQRAATEGHGEETLLRLESDENLVQVMTVHKAKGLEFPVVFCPFLWDASPQYESRAEVEFHDDDGVPVLDLGGPDRDLHRERALEEAAAEDLRLLYVALTRASHRCVAIWGKTLGSAYSPLRGLLHANGESGWRRGLERFKRMEPVTAHEEAESCLRSLDIAVDRMEVEGTGAPAVLGLEDRAGVVARTKSRRIPSGWQIHSYSGLSSDGTGGAVRDTDRLDREPDGDDPGEGIFGLAAGPRVGLLFHDILESLPGFEPSDADLIELVTRKVDQYGQDPESARLIADHLRGCLATQLNSDDPTLTLAALPAGDIVREMEFYLPMVRTRLQEIMTVVRPGEEIPLDRPLEEGFLRGYIDLVFRHRKRFYVVDYKSNRLGRTLDDYAPQALSESVRSSLYDLQYSLYSVAVHRLLQQRLPGYRYEDHFGGVYYLYLRGMRPESGPFHGVHHVVPNASSVAQLSRILSLS